MGVHRLCMYNALHITLHVYKSSGQLAQLVKALASLTKGPGFEPDLAPTHITRLLFPQLAI